ncbi:hypothetical protein LPJGGPFB_04538 [Ensifer adhaerens]|uniref:Uncharacterized protein n=1 Tax=Ensifer adhaerens TaxID=106592 RepID=A0ACC5T4U0_ENSAD|nr:hypothetical protein [Ensifer adhaerens]NRP21279.1 hypothetical protein [Ensifer adhaerens]
MAAPQRSYMPLEPVGSTRVEAISLGCAEFGRDPEISVRSLRPHIDNVATGLSSPRGFLVHVFAHAS